MENKMHKWSLDIETSIEICTECGVCRRKTHYNLGNALNPIKGWSRTEYLVGDAWTSAKNNEYRWCKSK